MRRALQKKVLDPTPNVRAPSDLELQLVDPVTCAQAFTELFRQSFGTIAARIERLGWRREEADDITADAFGSGWQTVSSYHPSRGSFLTWMTSIARSKGWSRRRSRTEVLFSQFDRGAGSADLEPVSRRDRAADEIENREAAARAFQVARRRLTSREMRVLFLRHKRGLGVAEIALHLDTTEATVRSTLSKAIRKLGTAITQ